MKVACPVCGKSMEQAGYPNIHSCPARKTRISELDLSLEQSHATVFLDDNNNQTYCLIICGIYKFEIFNQDKAPLTIIKRLQKNSGHISDKINFNLFKNSQFDWVEIVKISAVVTLPWNDIERVKECVKTYLIFS
jgi:hypothetical protein